MSQHTMVPISGDELPVIFDDIIEFIRGRQHLISQVESRLRFPLDGEKAVLLDDAYLTYRTDDSGREYYEWKSDSIGYQKGYRQATKRMSVSSDKKAEFPYFIALMTPWVRYNLETKQNEVLYTAYQLDRGAERLEPHGFTEEDANQWVPAKRVKLKNDTHVWQAL